MRPFISLVVCAIAVISAHSLQAQELKPLREDRDLIRNLIGLDEPLPIAWKFRAIKLGVRGTDNLRAIDVQVDPLLRSELETLAMDIIRKRLQELAVTDIEVLPWNAPDPQGLQVCEVLNVDFKLTFLAEKIEAKTIGLGATSVVLSRIRLARSGAAGAKCADYILGGVPTDTKTTSPYLFATAIGDGNEAVLDIKESLQWLIDYDVLTIVVASNHAAQGTVLEWLKEE